MRTIIIKRDYSLIINFFIIIILFYIVRVIFCNIFESLENNYHLTFNKYYNISEEKFEAISSEIYRQRYSNEVFYGVLIVIFSLAEFYILSKKLKSKKEKLWVFSILFILTFSVFANTSNELRFNPLHKNNYISFLIFLPILFYIYKLSIIGVKIDVTDDIKEKLNIRLKEDTDDLDNLLKMELITKKEYTDKKEKYIKDKIKIELKNSDEYNLLLKSKEKGILTEEEFNTKIENLVSKKSQADK